MTMRKFQLTLAAFVFTACAAALSYAASSYKVMLPSDLSVGGKMLKAGDYTVSVEDKDAVFKKGKEVIRIPTVIEKSSSKFGDTALQIDGKTLKEIDLGGTDTILTFGRSN